MCGNACSPVDDRPRAQTASVAGAARVGDAHGDATPHRVHIRARPEEAPRALRITRKGRRPTGHTLLMAATHTDGRVYTQSGAEGHRVPQSEDLS